MENHTTGKVATLDDFKKMQAKTTDGDAVDQQHQILKDDLEKAIQTGEHVEQTEQRLKNFEAENAEFVAGKREDDSDI